MVMPAGGLLVTSANSYAWVSKLVARFISEKSMLAFAILF